MSKLINRALIKMKKMLTHKKYDAVKFNFFCQFESELT